MLQPKSAPRPVVPARTPIPAACAEPAAAASAITRADLPYFIATSRLIPCCMDIRTCPPRPSATSLRQQRIAPLFDHEGFDQAFEDEGILLRKGLRLRSRLENRPVPPVSKRAYADDDAPRDELVYDPLVAREHRHDRLPAGARRLPDDDGFHEIPPSVICPSCAFDTPSKTPCDTSFRLSRRPQRSRTLYQSSAAFPPEPTIPPLLLLSRPSPPAARVP